MQYSLKPMLCSAVVVIGAVASLSSPAAASAGEVKVAAARAAPSAAAGAASATYVSASGSDAYPGTQSRPWRTLQFAVTQAAAGSTINVAAGTYDGFLVSRPGLTIVGAGPNKTVIRGSDTSSVVTIAAAATTISNVGITGCSPIDLGNSGNGYESGGTANIAITNKGVGATVANVAITGRSTSNSFGLPFGCFGVAARGAADVTVTRSDISGTGAAVFIRGGGDADTITNNRIHDNVTMIRNTPAANDDFGGDGIAVSSLVAPDPVYIGANTIFNNSAVSHDYGTDGSAFDVYGAFGLVITGNTVYNNENVIETGSGMGLGGGCGNMSVTNNKFSGLSAGSKIGHGDGILLRCARNSVFTGNTMTGLTWWDFWLTPRAAMPNEADDLTISGNMLTQGNHAIFSLSSNPRGHDLQITGNSYAYQAAFAYDWNHQPVWNLAAFSAMTGCSG